MCVCAIPDIIRYTMEQMILTRQVNHVCVFIIFPYIVTTDSLEKYRAYCKPVVFLPPLSMVILYHMKIQPNIWAQP